MGLFYSFSPQDRTSVVYDYKTIDTSKDFIVSLEYACYGDTLSGAEGFSLFFDQLHSNQKNNLIHFIFRLILLIKEARFYF